MLKSLAVLIVAACSLVSAVQFDTFRPGQLSSYQKHYKTPLGVDWQGTPIPLSKKFLSAKHVPFIPHPAGAGSWLGMNFDFQYVKPVFAAVNSTEVPLLNRGDAHITVISPPEFGVLSAAGITIDQINKIATDMKIQASDVQVVCLGKENVVLSGTRDIVYQIIVKSNNLINIREEIFRLYVKQNGNTALFDPRSFWPHITVGFTSTDVFIENGVYKGANVCYRPIRLTK